MKEKQLIYNAFEKINENKKNRKEDPYRLKFHLMPPVGLLNDPNGLIQYKGIYHVFYQWNPFETSHGAKFWGHYTSTDMIHWKEEYPALIPSESYEKNGCYSGSAVEREGQLILFYTGNVKTENNERKTYQCKAVSNDRIHFEKSGPILFLPDGFTSHFRDPKVWKKGNTWYMIIGAQTVEEQGAAVLFSSSDLEKWEYKGPIAGSLMNGLGPFGYMWECPDFFELDYKDVLLVSPQGLEPEGYKYQNLFQSGYFIGKWREGTTEFPHGEFTELDRGFDFYAPQTFQDERGRRIMIGWMGITDEREAFQPTIEKGWIHALSMPRELVLHGEKLYQKPLLELMKLRNSKDFSSHISLKNEEKLWQEICGDVMELKVEFEKIEAKTFKLSIRNNVEITVQLDKEIVTLKRKSWKDGLMESRSCLLKRCEQLHLFLDTSSVELFLNDGQEVFTARFFPDPSDKEIIFYTDGQIDFFLEKWSLKAYHIDELSMNINN
ncbi:sucrose-6-phosphate hydrolase [Metabacillus fastidiosus]|uniref:glycoside hydrolase family 32 protein n=1 Tax=Metabacillus fastidiosus TaxID=1458 RepID=UPI002DB56E29|nr:sucrose-6-phosphate hydrolase [Metabacillus fastidiosus]MEC2076272.1 sucrose-6-phosphate hydrolase [Metabacillus fastidiosus]